MSDINESMLSVGRDRATANGYLADIEFLVADAENLPLPDGSFDRVSMAFGLRNCTNKDKVIAEAFRLLKPGGRFLVLEFSQLQIAGLEKLYDAWSFQALPKTRPASSPRIPRATSIWPRASACSPTRRAEAHVREQRGLSA